MNQESIVFEKRFRKFARETILVVNELKKYHHYQIIDQATRSATSIAANFCESRVARSEKEFVSILGIALKEAKETEYWLKLINDLKLISSDRLDSLRKESTEIVKILTANVNTNLKKLNKT